MQEKVQKKEITEKKEIKARERILPNIDHWGPSDISENKISKYLLGKFQKVQLQSKRTKKQS